MLFVIYENYTGDSPAILRINDSEAGKEEVKKQIIARPDAIVIRGQELKVIPVHVEGL